MLPMVGVPVLIAKLPATFSASCRPQKNRSIDYDALMFVGVSLSLMLVFGLLELSRFTLMRC